jgi:hypothetical protein
MGGQTINLGTTSVPIRDQNISVVGDVIKTGPQMSNVGKQVEVTTNCQLMDAKYGNPITGLYGIGQGYSLPTSDPSVQAEQRYGAKADSVGLYIKQIGNKILQQVLPHKKIKFVTPQSSDIAIST